MTSKKHRRKKNRSTIPRNVDAEDSTLNGVGSSEQTQARSFFPTGWWSKVDLTTGLMIIGYGLCRLVLDIPKLDRIPQTVRSVIGAGLMFAATTHVLILLRVLFSIRLFLADDGYRKRLLVLNTVGRVVSATVISMAFIYGFGLVDTTAAFIQFHLPALGHRMVGIFSNSAGWISSIITGIVSNAVFNYLRGFVRRLRRRRASKKKDTVALTRP